MKRRQFFETGLGSVVLMAFGGARWARAAEKAPGQHQHSPISGALANATVSFGYWPTGIDRFPNLGGPVVANGHQLIPNAVRIMAGGTVNFIIAGFHHVLVYDDGTQPEDINTNSTIAPTTQPGPPLINDPTDRIYRGLDPSVLPVLRGSTPAPVLQDRVEVVQFPDPGTYLVICGVLPHFVNDRMFGFVTVIP